MKLIAINASPSDTSKTHAVAAAAVDLATDADGSVLDIGSLDADALLLRGSHPSVAEAIDAIDAGRRAGAGHARSTGPPTAVCSRCCSISCRRPRWPARPACWPRPPADRCTSSASTSNMRALVASLDGWSVPTVVYATGADFDERQPTGAGRARAAGPGARRGPPGRRGPRRDVRRRRRGHRPRAGDLPGAAGGRRAAEPRLADVLHRWQEDVRHVPRRPPRRRPAGALVRGRAGGAGDVGRRGARPVLRAALRRSPGLDRRAARSRCRLGRGRRDRRGRLPRRRTQAAAGRPRRAAIGRRRRPTTATRRLPGCAKGCSSCGRSPAAG